MKNLLNASFIYMLVGVASGLFYREFTKLNDFPEGQFTQLGLAHTHLLTLGFIVLLIVLVIEKVFTISRSPKLFAWFFWLYNAGVILTSGMLIWHGSLTVLGQESNAMIAGIAGLGHIAITAGMIVFFVALRRAVTGRTPVPAEAAAALTMTAAPTTQESAPTRREWLGLAVLSIGLGLIVLDGTIVGVTLPAIIGDLHLDLTDAQWVNSLYAVLLAALLLSTGNLADRWGRKRLFLAGLIVFVAGSLLAAAASTAGVLIGARAVQAVGAAFIMPSTLSTVNAVFRGKYRAAAFGVWGAVISGAAAVGPLAGGALTQWASWHWIFLVNLPLGVLVFIAALFTVPETRGEKKRPGIDVDGALLSAIGFGALVFAVIEGPDLGWWTPKSDLTVFGWVWPKDAAISAVPVAFAVAAIALVLFVIWERHREKVQRAALLDLDLFSFSTFSWGNLTAAMVAVGEFAIIFVLPLYLINALGLDVMGAGLVLAAMAVGAFLSGAAARHLAARFGAPGTVLIGLGLEVAGVLVLALLLGPATPGWLIAIPLVVYGLGLGLASAQLTGTVLRDIPAEVSGQGSAIQSTVRQIGSALGTAFAGATLSISLALTLPTALGDAGLTGAEADSLADATRQSAGTTIMQLREQGSSSSLGDQTATAVDALTSGFADATRWALLIATVFLALGFIGALRLRRASVATPINPSAQQEAHPS